MHDLLSKYLTGDISSEEKQTLFLLLKENTELKKEAADIQNLSALVSIVREEHPASDMQYRSFAQEMETAPSTKEVTKYFSAS